MCTSPLNCRHVYGVVLAREHAKGSVQTSKQSGGGGRSMFTVGRPRPSPRNVSGRVKRDDSGKLESDLRRRRMGSPSWTTMSVTHPGVMRSWRCHAYEGHQSTQIDPSALPADDPAYPAYLSGLTGPICDWDREDVRVIA
jgi:hypothetical protein